MGMLRQGTVCTKTVIANEQIMEGARRLGRSQPHQNGNDRSGLGVLGTMGRKTYIDTTNLNIIVRP